MCFTHSSSYLWNHKQQQTICFQSIVHNYIIHAIRKLFNIIRNIHFLTVKYRMSRFYSQASYDATFIFFKNFSYFTSQKCGKFFVCLVNYKILTCPLSCKFFLFKHWHSYILDMDKPTLPKLLIEAANSMCQCITVLTSFGVKVS